MNVEEIEESLGFLSQSQTLYLFFVFSVSFFPAGLLKRIYSFKSTNKGFGGGRRKKEKPTNHEISLAMLLSLLTGLIVKF